jgi:protocatechuate 3,4-dioxygenase beta subunit
MYKNLISMVILVSLATPLFVQANDCVLTPHRTTGTHYQAVTTQKINVSEGVIVRGKVLGFPGCKPVVGAKISHWQAGEDGYYQDRLRAYLFTDVDGRFQFETEWPNLHSPHIHFIVNAEGYKVLETQWIGDSRQEIIDFTLVIEKR